MRSISARDQRPPTALALIGRDRVDQVTAQRTFEANLSTVRTADDMLGAPLNITA